jgi:hypothetical protein
MINKFNYKQKEPDFFDQAIGKPVKVFTKLVDSNICFCYVGILVKKSKDFVYLKDGRIMKIENDREIETKTFAKVALNKGIISWVEFD